MGGRGEFLGGPCFDPYTNCYQVASPASYSGVGVTEFWGFLLLLFTGLLPVKGDICVAVISLNPTSRNTDIM